MSQYSNTEVRLVNTFTTLRNKTTDKTKKGITCISRSTSQKKMNLAGFKIPRKDEQNHNFANYDLESQNIILLNKISQLQNQVLLLEKQKIQLEKRQQEPFNNMTQSLVRSHYITKQEDIQELIKQKNKLMEIVNEYQEQNAILSVNIDIREKYILKMQQEMNSIQARQNSKQNSTTACQTQSLKEDLIPQNKNEDVKKYQSSYYFNDSLLRLQLQNKDLKERINILTQQNTRIQKQVQNAQKRYKQRKAQYFKVDQENHQKQSKYRSMNYMQRNENHAQNIFQNRQGQYRKEVLKQLSLIDSLTEQLSLKNEKFIILQQKNQALILQNNILRSDLSRKENEVQIQYKNCRQELDALMNHLEQQSELLIRKKTQINLQYSDFVRLKDITNQQNCKINESLDNIVEHYQNRIAKIQTKFDSYIEQCYERQRAITRQLAEKKQANLIQDNMQVRSLLKRLQNYQSIIAELKIQISKKQQNELYLKQKLVQTQNLNSKIWQDMQKFSLQLQQQARHDQIRQIDISQQISFLVKAKKDLQMDLIQLKESNAINISSLQSSIHQLQHQLREEVLARKILEENHCQKLILVKNDYDVLYNKYLKYKNMSASMQLRLQATQY